MNAVRVHKHLLRLRSGQPDKTLISQQFLSVLLNIDEFFDLFSRLKITMATEGYVATQDAWTKFSEVDPRETVAPSEDEGGALSLSPEQVAYCVIGSVGLAGNVVVVVVILRSASMRKVVTTTFIVNQSLVDALVAAILVINYLPHTNARTAFSATHVWDQFVCRVWMNKSLLWAMFMVSSLNLVALTVERLVAVAKPLWHKISFTRSKQAVILALLWGLGPLTAIVHGVIDASISPSGECIRFGMGGSLGRAIGFLQISLEFAFPVLVFIVSYSIIAWILHRQEKVMTQHNPMAITTSSKKVHGGRNVIKTMVLVSLCFAVCWSSNEVYYIMYLMGVTIDFGSPFYVLSVNIVFVNCCCNPFIYIFQYKAFQREVRKLLGCKPVAVEDSSTT